MLLISFLQVSLRMILKLNGEMGEKVTLMWQLHTFCPKAGSSAMSYICICRQASLEGNPQWWHSGHSRARFLTSAA